MVQAPTGKILRVSVAVLVLVLTASTRTTIRRAVSVVPARIGKTRPGSAADRAPDPIVRGKIGKAMPNGAVSVGIDGAARIAMIIRREQPAARGPTGKILRAKWAVRV